jgi:hypothetical protein
LSGNTRPFHDGGASDADIMQRFGSVMQKPALANQKVPSPEVAERPSLLLLAAPKLFSRPRRS